MKGSLLALLPFLLLAVDAAPARCTSRPKPRPSASSPSPTASPPVPTTVTSSSSVLIPTNAAPSTSSAVVVAPLEPEPVDPNPVEPKPIDPNPTDPAPSPLPAPPVIPVTDTPGNSAVGLALNNDSKAKIPSFGGRPSWYYSWNTNPLVNTEGLEFVPMIWGGGAADEFDGKLPAGTKHVMGFNEPDIGPEFGGSMIDPVSAAEKHKKWVAQVADGIKIGSPGVARGGARWLREFNQACGGTGCQYDFIPYHFYGTNAEDLITYTKEFSAEFKKPLWLTEVACHDYATNTICSADETKAFMNTIINFFRSAEGKTMVERWSWFGAFPNHAKTNPNGLLDEDGSANEMGLYYASL